MIKIAKKLGLLYFFLIQGQESGTQRSELEEYLMLLRGVLGNKCAGQYNLKTLHFKETIVLGNFWPWSSVICVFFAALYLPQDGASSPVAIVGATP
jgi:hypothetical protein